MSNLPTAEDLAAVMSSVTEPLCGTRFEPCDPQARGESVCGRMFLLSFDGAKRDINVLLSCGPNDSHLLAASLFGVSPGTHGAERFIPPSEAGHDAHTVPAD